MSEISQNEAARIALAKQQRRLELRKLYIKQISDPHRHATGEGGTVFDAGLQRFQAMRVSNYEHFRPTGKSARIGGLLVVAPIVLYAWWMKADRDKLEAKYRRGEVAYKDRRFKFI